MGKSIPVTIGDIAFSKKGDALSCFREMLNRYRLNDTVSIADHNFLLAALNKHPEASQKIGAGISYFTVEKSPDHRTRCFWAHRVDGSSVDFSYKSCVT